MTTEHINILVTETIHKGKIISFVKCDNGSYTAQMDGQGMLEITMKSNSWIVWHREYLNPFIKEIIDSFSLGIQESSPEAAYIAGVKKYWK